MSSVNSINCILAVCARSHAVKFEGEELSSIPLSLDVLCPSCKSPLAADAGTAGLIWKTHLWWEAVGNSGYPVILDYHGEYDYSLKGVPLSVSVRDFMISVGIPVEQLASFPISEITGIWEAANQVKKLLVGLGRPEDEVLQKAIQASQEVMYTMAFNAMENVCHRKRRPWEDKSPQEWQRVVQEGIAATLKV